MNKHIIITQDTTAAELAKLAPCPLCKPDHGWGVWGLEHGCWRCGGTQYYLGKHTLTTAPLATQADVDAVVPVLLSFDGAAGYEVRLAPVESISLRHVRFSKTRTVEDVLKKVTDGAKSGIPLNHLTRVVIVGGSAEHVAAIVEQCRDAGVSCVSVRPPCNCSIIKDDKAVPTVVCNNIGRDGKCWVCERANDRISTAAESAPMVPCPNCTREDSMHAKYGIYECPICHGAGQVPAEGNHNG